MGRREAIGGSYRVHARLGGRGGESLLVSDSPRDRRGRWVLRWLPGPAAVPLRSRLRADILELASLRHEALALPLHLGADAARGRPFLVRPYIEGSDIVTALSSRPARDLVPWMLSAAEALGILHAFGLAHGNVKPANLIVPRRALGARRARPGDVVLCDPAWWPPGRGSRDEDPTVISGVRAGGRPAAAPDFFALGAVFHRLLTGGAFEPERGGFPTSLRASNPAVPVDLERLVMKLLNPEPTRRYHDAGALIEDLRSVCGARSPELAAVPDCFVGRQSELAEALALLADRGESAAIAVAGEAGAGKSAFLRRLGLEAQLEGHRAISLRCHPESSRPFALPAAILDRLTPPGGGGDALRRRFRRWLERATARGGSGSPAAPGDAGGHRALLQELVATIAAACGGSPTLILVDDAHLAAPATLELLAALAGEIGCDRERDASKSARPPSLAFSFRSESPFRPPLRALLEGFGAEARRRRLLELGRLDATSLERWLEQALAHRGDVKARLGAVASREAMPYAVREAIRRCAAKEGTAPRAGAADLDAVQREYLEGLSEERRKVLVFLAILARPAPASLLAPLLELPEGRLRALLEPLLREGTVAEEGGSILFQHGSFAARLAGSLPERARRGAHRRVAQALAARRGEAAEEIARHWLHSDAPAKGLGAALAAARELLARHDAIGALRFYPRVLELLPRRRRTLRRAVSGEAAEAYAATGDHARAIAMVAKLLAGARGPRARGSLHGRLGVLHHRAGNAALAVLHLEKGLALLGPARGARFLRERLRLQSELAEIANNKGDHALAESICRRALDELGRTRREDRDLEVRREEMVLLETRGHLKLRRFEYAEARELLEQSLELSRAIDADADRGLILNNLGIVYIQENLFPRALACYREAETLASRFGDVQNLTAIRSNLAVLHAKTGDLAAADREVGRLASGAASGGSPRTRLLRLHAAGLVDHLAGRYASAVANLTAAIELGEELGDAHKVGFDLVYLGESHLLRGELKAAAAAFDRAGAAGDVVPAPVPAMAAARRALLLALRGDERGARSGVTPPPAVPGRGEVEYLDAWNRVYRGWALRLAASPAEAEAMLEPARRFFARAGVPAGEVHATLELAACDLDRGEAGDARRRLAALAGALRPGEGVLRHPALAARLLAYQTWAQLESPSPDLEEAASLLVEAESYLIGRRLRDLEGLARRLRRRLHAACLEVDPGAGLPARLPREPAGGPEVLDLLDGASALVRRLAQDGAGEEGAGRRGELEEVAARLDATRRALEARRPAASELVGAAALVGSSPAMRRVLEAVARLAPGSFPVLVSGETGTGKELVARALHGESPRRASPFVSVGCAALPVDLLEAELFGHCQGAFTGADRDRPGLLRSAAGGTFFFDEVAELPAALQAKLLKLLDRPVVRPLGGVEEVPIDVRFIFSTSRDLRRLAEEGAFRADLLYRLAAFEVHLPPLRERLEDLPALVEHFRRFIALAGEAPEFEAEALAALVGHSWPGNVRELQNAVFRLTLSCKERVRAADVERVLGKEPARGVFPAMTLRGRRLPELQEALEREYLVQLHSDCGGDLEAMARALGIRRRALYDRFRRLGIRPRDLA